MPTQLPSPLSLFHPPPCLLLLMHTPGLCLSNKLLLLSQALCSRRIELQLWPAGPGFPLLRGLFQISSSFFSPLHLCRPQLTGQEVRRLLHVLPGPGLQPCPARAC